MTLAVNSPNSSSTFLCLLALLGCLLSPRGDALLSRPFSRSLTAGGNGLLRQSTAASSPRPVQVHLCPPYRKSTAQWFQQHQTRYVTDDNNPWKTRRRIVRQIMLPVLDNMARKLAINATEADSNQGKLQLVQSKEERRLAKQEKRDKESRYGVLVTTFFVAIGAAVLRLGGRGALLNLLGLDFIQGAEIREQIDSFVVGFQSMGGLGPLGFFVGWLVAKVACLDFIGVSLALSSGVLFGGVAQGMLASVVASVAASTIVFLLSRYSLSDQIRPEIEKRSLLRAVDGAVAREGFKTVFVLRLSPILPIPIGAYNYIYGVTKVTLPAFMAGISLASFKPYFLDSYLGVFGKSVIDKVEDGGATDALLLVVLGAIVAVGTLATQVAGTVYDEIKAEAKLIDQDRAAAPPLANTTTSATSATAATPTFVSWIFGLLDGKNVPQWATKVQDNVQAARGKMTAVLQDEVVSLIEEQRYGFNIGWQFDETVLGNRTELPQPLELKSQAERKVCFCLLSCFPCCPLQHIPQTVQPTKSHLKLRTKHSSLVFLSPPPPPPARASARCSTCSSSSPRTRREPSKIATPTRVSASCRPTKTSPTASLCSQSSSPVSFHLFSSAPFSPFWMKRISSRRCEGGREANAARSETEP